MISWLDKVKALKEAKPGYTLEDLLVLARTHTMTPEEVEAQRRSWVVSELVLAGMSRGDADDCYHWEITRVQTAEELQQKFVLHEGDIESFLKENRVAVLRYLGVSK